MKHHTIPEGLGEAQSLWLPERGFQTVSDSFRSKKLDDGILHFNKYIYLFVYICFTVHVHPVSNQETTMVSCRFFCRGQAVLLSSTFVRDAFRGILRARVLSAQGLRGAGMAGAVAVGGSQPCSALLG